jgi:putative transcriptional regulator
MKKGDFESLRKGMAEAKAWMEGAREGYVAHEPVDVRAVRARTALKRKEFAELYRLDPRTVEQWEQGRRRPERGTEMYLRLIDHDPDRMAKMVSQVVREQPAPYRAAPKAKPPRAGAKERSQG